MRAEEIDNLTEQELRDRANDCFVLAEQGNGQVEKLRLHLEAQYYLTLVVRKRDDRVARRDFWMEVAVIALIGLEIVLSVYGIHAQIAEGNTQIKEGNDQTAILAGLQVSTATTARASQSTAEVLPRLTAKEADALKSLDQMNTKLRDSLKATTTMAATAQSQLQILQREQAEGEAEQAKKPKLSLWWGDDIDISNPYYRNFTPSSETDTSATFYFVFRNNGTATATKIELTVEPRAGTRAGKNVVDVESVLPFSDPPGSRGPYHVLKFEYLRPGEARGITLTFTFMKGLEPFPVYFEVDADQVRPNTQLGWITVRPRKPQN